MPYCFRWPQGREWVVLASDSIMTTWEPGFVLRLMTHTLALSSAEFDSIFLCFTQSAVGAIVEISGAH